MIKRTTLLILFVFLIFVSGCVAPVDTNTSDNTTDLVNNTDTEIIESVVSDNDTEEVMDEVPQEPAKTILGTYEGKTITLIDVSEVGDSCIIDVDGVSGIIEDGTVETINGVRIRVTDVIPLRNADQQNDICEVIIG